ncbi:AAA family ATPase [Thermodesulfobacteriota bacterium]
MLFFGGAFYAAAESLVLRKFYLVPGTYADFLNEHLFLSSSMDYLSSLQCKTEPFVSPPGSEIYLCEAVRDLTEKLSHNIHLGAGLQLVISAEGSGKTTLLNQLAQKFSADNKTVVLLISNPLFRDLQQFLITVAGIFKTINAPSGFDDNTFQKAFNSFFFKLYEQEKKTVLLLIDNGQNLPDFCLHALNSFYDYHPDCRRFLQTVICGEPSFQRKINTNKALNNHSFLATAPKPFNFKDIGKLIRFHLEHAAADPGSPPALFSIPAQWVIYRMAQGHPQKTIDLCHFIVLTLVIENRKKADWFLTLRSAKLFLPERANKLQIIRTTFLSSLIVLMLVLGLWSEEVKTLNVSRNGHLLQVAVPQKVQPQETKPVKPVEVTQETFPPERTREAPPQISPVIKKTLPPVLPTEEQGAGTVPAKSSTAVSDLPEVQASTAEVSVPESAEVVDEEAMSELKPIPEVETIVTPAIRETREVKPGDTLLVMIQQVYGPGYIKKQYIDRVIDVNPHLKSPDNLEVGDQVFFPADFVQEEAKPPVAAAASESLPGTKSVPDQQPVYSPDLIDKRVEPPEYLGDIITAPGEAFGDMVRRIYGPWSFNPENVKTVIAANPNLKNPELLNVGDKIRFPTIPVALTPKAEEVWWVRIITYDNIQSAYRFLRKYRKSPPPLVIIPSRDKSGQVLMNILLEEYFMDTESAQKAIQALPGVITAQAEALHGLSPATFFYLMKKQND